MKRLLILACLLLVPTLVFAQAQTSGSIAGTAVDEDGAPVVGATVTAISTDTGLERETKSDDNGDFYFGLLPVGNWSVTVIAPDMQPQVYSFRLGVGETVPVNAVLVGGETIAEEITVSSTATALETTQSGENLDYRGEVENLPIENRDINVVARLSAQVSGNTRTGSAITIAGAPSYDTTVLLDGAEISDPFFGTGTTVYLEDAIEEVQVLTSGIGARYGRFQGGVINAITKSGSNKFEAAVRFEFSQEDWNEQTPFNENQSDVLDEVYQATAGGFILKDYLWYFGGYREIPATTDARTTGGTGASFTTSSAEDRTQIKLRGAPVSNHVIDASYLEFEAVTDPWASRNLNPGHLQAVNGVRGDPRETRTLTYQGVLSSNMFLELQGTEKEVAILAGGDPSTGNSPFIDWNTFDVYSNYWWDASDLDNRSNETLSGNLTYVLNTDSAGTHSFEGGVQQVTSITGGENKQSPTDYNLIGFNSDFISSFNGAGGQPLFNIRNGVTERWTAIPLGGEQEIENTAIYVQDTINAGKWRFDIGVRYDDYEATGPSAFPLFNLAFDDIAPRLGVTYNLADSWQLLGTWGKYVSRFNDNFVQGATGVGTAPSIDHLYSGPDATNLTVDQANAIVQNDALWQTISGFSGPGIANEYLANDISAPYAEDLQLSVRKALANNAGTIVLTYINRDFEDLLSDFVGGVCTLGLNFSHDVSSCSNGAANFTDILDANGQVTGQVDTTVWANDPNARRSYEGLSLSVDLRPSSTWGIGGSITVSEAIGNYEGEGENTPAGGGVLGAYIDSRPEEGASPFGTVDEDVPTRLNLWGSYRLDFGRAGNLNLSAIARAESGQVWSRTATTPYNNQPQYLTDNGTYTHFFGGRGTQRFENFRRLDFSARYDIKFWRSLGLWVKATVINLTNEDALIEYNTDASAQNINGVLTWVPNGNCGLGDTPSTSCTGFGRISDEEQYQRPREYFFTVGLQF